MSELNKDSAGNKPENKFRRLISMVEDHAEKLPDDLPQDSQNRNGIIQSGEIDQRQETEKVDSLQGIPDLDAGGTCQSVPESALTTPNNFSDATPPSSAPAIDAS